MDDGQLTERIKELIKAVATAPGEITRLLEDLKKDAAPSEEQLRSTKAGVTVGKLRSHANREVARLANEIVNKWRKKVDAAKAAKKRQMEAVNNNNNNSTGSPANSAAGSPAAASSMDYSKPYEGDPEKRHFKTDKVELERTSNRTRNNSIGLLYNGLAFRSTEPIEVVLVKAVEVEAALFKANNYEIKDNYTKKLRGLFTSLKRRDNISLGQRVMSGRIPADAFVVMTNEELASDEQRAKDRELERENMKKAQVPMAEKSISDSLMCSRCRQKKVSYSQAQTRSADEPMTTFCECVNCGHRWKFS